MSLFGQMLQKLFDNTEVFTRTEWARFLGIPESSISEWMNDKSIPRSDLLFMMVDFLRNTDGIPHEILLEFENMSKLPSRDVSPLADYIGNTVSEYMSETFEDIGRRLRGRSPVQQQRILSKGCIGPSMP